MPALEAPKADTNTLLDLDKLSVADRLAMIEAVWDSLCHNPDSVPVPDWHIEELERRAQRHSDSPLDGHDWPGIRADLLKRLA